MPEETQAADIDMAAIEAEARAEVLGEELPEKKAEEVKQPEQAKEPEEEGETDADAAPVEEDGDKEPEEDQEVAAEDKPKKKKSWGEREREKRLEVEAQFSEQLRQRDSEIAELKALVKQSLSGEKKESAEKKQWLDEDAQADVEAFKQEIRQEIETKDFTRFIAQSEAQWMAKDPQHEDKVKAVMAADIDDLVLRGGASREQVQKEFMSRTVEMWQDMHRRGVDVGAYYQRRAAMMFPQFRQTEQPKQKKASVDMKAMQELRDSAGAPTNKSVAATNGVVLDIDAIEKQARKEVLEAATYL